MAKQSVQWYPQKMEVKRKIDLATSMTGVHHTNWYVYTYEMLYIKSIFSVWDLMIGNEENRHVQFEVNAWKSSSISITL